MYNDILVELFWTEDEAVPSIKEGRLWDHFRIEDKHGVSFYTEETDPYEMWKRYWIVMSVQRDEVLQKVKTVRWLQLCQRLTEAQTALELFEKQKDQYKAEFQKMAQELESDKRAVQFHEDEMIVRCKLHPFESLVSRYRYDAVGKIMLLDKFPFLK